MPTEWLKRWWARTPRWCALRPRYRRLALHHFQITSVTVTLSALCSFHTQEQMPQPVVAQCRVRAETGALRPHHPHVHLIHPNLVKHKAGRSGLSSTLSGLVSFSTTLASVIPARRRPRQDLQPGLTSGKREGILEPPPLRLQVARGRGKWTWMLAYIKARRGVPFSCEKRILVWRMPRLHERVATDRRAVCCAGGRRVIASRLTGSLKLPRQRRNVIAADRATIALGRVTECKNIDETAPPYILTPVILRGVCHGCQPTPRRWLSWRRPC